MCIKSSIHFFYMHVFFYYDRICSRQHIIRWTSKIMGNFEILCGFGILSFLLYRYLTATFNFWKERGIPGPKPVLIFGTMKDVIFKNFFLGKYLKDIYDAYENTPFIGIFQMREPILIIKDPKFIKDVFIKDSSIFYSRDLNTCLKVCISYDGCNH